MRLIHLRFHEFTDTSAYISIYINIKVFYKSSLTLSSVVQWQTSQIHLVLSLKSSN